MTKADELDALFWKNKTPQSKDLMYIQKLVIICVVIVVESEHLLLYFLSVELKML